MQKATWFSVEKRKHFADARALVIGMKNRELCASALFFRALTARCHPGKLARLKHILAKVRFCPMLLHLSPQTAVVLFSLPKGRLQKSVAPQCNITFSCVLCSITVPNPSLTINQSLCSFYVVRDLICLHVHTNSGSTIDPGCIGKRETIEGGMYEVAYVLSCQSQIWRAQSGEEKNSVASRKGKILMLKLFNIVNWSETSVTWSKLCGRGIQRGVELR